MTSHPRIKSKTPAIEESIIEDSEDAIISKDLNGIITGWNSGAERLFGYKAEEMIGHSIMKIVPPDHPDDVMRILGAIARGERVHHFETVRLHKNGRRINVSLSVSPIRDSSGKIVGSSKIARDITMRKQAEDMLKRSVRLRDEFISVASHELKTPITAMKLQTQMIQRRVQKGDLSPLAPERMRKFISQMDGQIARLANLVDNLLDVSRLTNGRMALKREPVNLTELVHHVVSDLSELFDASGCEVQMNLPDGVEGNWDRYRLEQVLMNLLTNACRYAPEKPVTVSVLKPAPGVAELSVADKGGGIAKVDQKRIFERFERASSGSRDGGFGLDLYIVSEIVRAHGGSVEVDSPKDDGAVFRVKLPLDGETKG